MRRGGEGGRGGGEEEGRGGGDALEHPLVACSSLLRGDAGVLTRMQLTVALCSFIDPSITRLSAVTRHTRTDPSKPPLTCAPTAHGAWRMAGSTQSNPRH
jgi:hypothetical protein